MTAYNPVLVIHLSCVVLSVCLFILRGSLRFMESPVAHARILKIAPHVVDTLLLASAIALCVLLGEYPIRESWLSAKLLGVIAYIGFGLVAFRFGTSPAIRFGAFAAALLTVAYVIAVALTKSPWPLADG